MPRLGFEDRVHPNLKTRPPEPGESHPGQLSRQTDLWLQKLKCDRDAPSCRWHSIDSASRRFPDAPNTIPATPHDRLRRGPSHAGDRQYPPTPGARAAHFGARQVCPNAPPTAMRPTMRDFRKLQPDTSERDCRLRLRPTRLIEPQRVPQGQATTPPFIAGERHCKEPEKLESDRLVCLKAPFDSRRCIGNLIDSGRSKSSPCRRPNLMLERFFKLSRRQATPWREAQAGKGIGMIAYPAILLLSGRRKEPGLVRRIGCAFPYAFLRITPEKSICLTLLTPSI